MALEIPCLAFRAGVQASCAEQVLPSLGWRLLGPCLKFAGALLGSEGPLGGACGHQEGSIDVPLGPHVGPEGRPGAVWEIQ